MEFLKYIDFCALVISILAFIFSIKTHFENIKLTKQSVSISEKDLNRKFFEDIYFEYLTTKVPNEIRKLDNISYIKNNGTEEINDLFLEILDISYFNRFLDFDFYKRICDIIVSIEDLLFRIDEEKSFDEIRKLRKELNEDKIRALYKLFKEYYSV